MLQFALVDHSVGRFEALSDLAIIDEMLSCLGVDFSLVFLVHFKLKLALVGELVTFVCFSCPCGAANFAVTLDQQ